MDTVQEVVQETNVMLDQLKEVKAQIAGLKEEVQNFLDEAMKAPIYRALDRALEEALETSESLEYDIRANGIKLYLNDCEMPERTGIRNYKKVSIIDEATAKEWALRNFTPALKLDTKIFNDAAKMGNVPMHLVVITTEPQVTIAEKL